MGEGSRLGTGDRIADYRIELVLNRGELWDLAAAAHVVLPRLAAIRIAQPGQPTAGVRLLREACIIEALTHPGVPRLYDCGRLADRRPWVATERVVGRVLAEMIGHGPMPPARVAALVRDVAAVLEHTHRRGIVHRAVRPETILFTDADERGWPVCLCDWSEARTLDAVPAPRRTGPHDAPEVARGETYDGAVDVYALGVVAYEALSGTRLFDGAAPLAMVADHVTRYVGARGVVTPALARLAWLVDDMLAPDAAGRPTAADVRAVAAQLATDLDAEQADSKALAMAMLAVEEIALAELADDPIDAEVIAIDLSGSPAPGPTPPKVDPVPASRAVLGTLPPPTALARGSSTNLDRSAGAAVIGRMRRPRWTPSGIKLSSDQAKLVSGEIDTVDPSED